MGEYEKTDSQEDPERMPEESKVEYLCRIRWRYHLLSKKNKKIADYIINHKKEAKSLSINQLAAKIGTNAPALTRFAQFLGFKGFSELKFYIENDILSASVPDKKITAADSIALIKQKLIAQSTAIIEDTISMLDNKKVESVIRTLLLSERIELYAEGGSAATLCAFYNMLIQLGLPCRMHSDSLLAITAASQLDKKGCAVSFSYSGSSINCINFFKEARQQHAATIAITGYVSSPLARLADASLFTSTKFDNDLRDMHNERLSEMCIVGILQNCLFSRMSDSLSRKQIQLTEATRRTRLKSGYDILF